MSAEQLAVFEPRHSGTMAPRVSICIPARNAASTLKCTLDSVLSQDYTEREIVVSDNRSSDDTVRIASSFPGVRLVHFEAGEDALGESNWNFAIQQSRGQLVALYHADDVYEPSIVRKQAQFLDEHPEATAVFTLSSNVDEAGLPTGLGDVFGPADFEDRTILTYEQLLGILLRGRNPLRTPTFMGRRSSLEAAGGFDPKRFRSSSDLDLWLRLAKIGPIGVIHERLHKYRITTSQGGWLLNKNRTTTADFFAVVDAHLAESCLYLGPGRARDGFEAYRSLDALLCINNLLLQGERAIAWARFRDRFSGLSEVMRGAHSCGLRFVRLFILTMAHLIAHRTGFGRAGSAGYRRLYEWNLKRLRASC